MTTVSLRIISRFSNILKSDSLIGVTEDDHTDDVQAQVSKDTRRPLGILGY